MILAVNYDSFHTVLRGLFEEMLPLCENMTMVAQGLAGIGAMLYVAYRVWQSLARAEPIDVFPLLRPFALGICIMFFPTIIINGLNGILSPVCYATHSLVENRTFKMHEFQQQKDRLEEAALYKDAEITLMEQNEEFENELAQLGMEKQDESIWSKFTFERSMFSLKRMIRNAFREILEVIFRAASLVIDTIRTFFLLVLAILGPISFAVSCFDGFQNTLVMWFSRYITVYLWLPISDILGAILARIQELMLLRDIQELTNNPLYVPDSSFTFLILFMIIGIIGYFCIPTISNWVVQAGGMGSYMRNINSTSNKSLNQAGAATGAASGNITGKLLK